MSDAFFEAFVIMVTGIGTVFAFLLLLLVAMRILQWLTAPVVLESESKAAISDNTATQNTIAPATIAAITAAVKRYRRIHQH